MVQKANKFKDLSNFQPRQDPDLVSNSEVVKLKEQLQHLKDFETDAREQVLLMHDKLRKQRVLNKFKEVCTQEKHQAQVDNLKQ